MSSVYSVMLMSTDCETNLHRVIGTIRTRYSNENFRFKESSSVVQWFACLLLDQRFDGSNPAEDDGLLRATKIRSMTSNGKEVKPSASCRKIIRHVEEPLQV
jgi:hypothetical protein